MQKLVLHNDEGQTVRLGALGVRFMVAGDETEGCFALVEHPLEPLSLAGPVHTHADTDEYSFVLEGEMAALIGEETLRAGPGTLVFKPRGVPHTFWNPGGTRARILEIITPGGFETYFREMAELLGAGGPPDLGRISEVMARYKLTPDLPTTFRVMREHGVSLPGLELPASG